VGSSESKGSFGQKEFYISNMGETALEEEPRGTLNIMIFLKNKSSFIHALHVRCSFKFVLYLRQTLIFWLFKPSS
jgi:hypothetical protein